MTLPPISPSTAPGPIDEGTPASKGRRTKWAAPTRARPPSPRAEKEPWVIRSRADFFDARVNPIKNHHLRMSLIIEAMCGVDCFCFHGNQEVAARYGCNRRHLQTIFKEMEGAKLIFRVEGVDDDDPDRVGIILLKRSDPDLPVADTEEALARAIVALKDRRFSRPTGPDPGAGGGAPDSARGARQTAPGGARQTAPVQRSKSTKTESTTKIVAEPDSRPRRDAEAPATPPEARTGTWPAAAPPPERNATPPRGDASPPRPPAGDPSLTEGQRAFLAALTLDQKARFAAWSDGRKAQVLAWFAERPDEVMLREALRQLAPTRPDPIPPPSATTPELIAALAGHAGGSLAARCARQIMDELADPGGVQSYAVLYNLCGQVVNRARSPDSLAVPFARTTERGREATRLGKPIENLAAYFMRGVTNWDREHPGPSP